MSAPALITDGWNAVPVAEARIMAQEPNPHFPGIIPYIVPGKDIGLSEAQFFFYTAAIVPTDGNWVVVEHTWVDDQVVFSTRPVLSWAITAERTIPITAVGLQLGAATAHVGVDAVFVGTEPGLTEDEYRDVLMRQKHGGRS